jgi:hypothetical protein
VLSRQFEIAGFAQIGAVFSGYILCLKKARLNGQRIRLMKKSDLSDAASNLLIVGSVSLAFAPFVLGDRLVLIVTGFMKEGGVWIDQLSHYVSWLFS